MSNRKCKNQGCARRFALFALAFVFALCLGGCGRSNQEWEYRPITDINNMEGRRVAVNLAWETDYALTGRRDLEVVRYDTMADMILALKFNKVDALATDDLLWKMLSAGSEGLHRVEPAFYKSGYMLYFSPGNEALRDEFNAFLEEYRNSEEYRDHMDRLNAFDGLHYEWPDIPQTGTGKLLRIAVDADGFPRSYPDPATGKAIGFDLEAMQYFANEKNYRLEISLSNYTDIVFGLLAGIYDGGGGYLSDVYEQEVIDAGMYPSAALDYSGLYFIEKTQPNIRVNSDLLG